MLHLRILCVGRTESGFVRTGVDHYLHRLRMLREVEWEEVRSAGHSGRPVSQALAAEGKSILKRVAASDRLVLLDEKGRECTSQGLAEWLERIQETGLSRLVLVVGGAYGHSREVRERAAEQLSLSRLTLPHQLVRIVLLEQLYRAATILAGQPYHHG